MPRLKRHQNRFQTRCKLFLNFICKRAWWRPWWRQWSIDLFTPKKLGSYLHNFHALHRSFKYTKYIDWLAKNGALNRRARRAQACVILRVRVRNKSFYVFAKKSLARGIFSAIVGAITINQRNIYDTCNWVRNRWDRRFDLPLWTHQGANRWQCHGYGATVVVTNRAW